MKTAFILAGAITLVLMSMEGPASASPAPSNEAVKVFNDWAFALKKAPGSEPECCPCRSRGKRSIFGDIGTLNKCYKILRDFGENL